MINTRFFCLIGIFCSCSTVQVERATADDLSEIRSQSEVMAEPPEKNGGEGLFGDRLSLKAGYKVWLARWQTTTTSINFEGTGVTGGPRQITSHDSVMSGPSATAYLALRNSPWFNSIVASFTFLNGGFDFQRTGFDTIFSRSGPQQEQQDATRKDYTATLGLSIWESVGLFAGYYWSEQRFTIDNSVQKTPGGPTFHGRSNPIRELQGPLVGIYASGSVNDRFSLYGNVAYALLSLRSDQPGFNTGDVQGWALELGTSVRGPQIWKIRTDLQIGFRGQMILKTFRENQPERGSPPNNFANDVTWGPTFTVSAVF